MQHYSTETEKAKSNLANLRNTLSNVVEGGQNKASDFMNFSQQNVLTASSMFVFKSKRFHMK